LTRRDTAGRYAAVVSIRSGRGSTTHDRVVRFVPVFESSEQAAGYAMSQGLAWLAADPVSLTPSLSATGTLPWPKKN